MNPTARFGLPTLAPGQSQKEWFHNEALHLADILFCPVAEGPPSTQPPPMPAEGQCFIVGNGAIDAWAGNDGKLAAFTDGGWRFISPVNGMSVWDLESQETWSRLGGTWERGVVRGQEIRIGGKTVVRERQATVSSPQGGAMVDAECRAALSALLSALRNHGLIG